jgi:DNA-binding transcriptional ArsR family regulator
MRKSKEPLPPPSNEDLLSVAKVLANQTSLTILRHLYKAGFGLNSSIVRNTGYSQSCVSKQLKVMRSLRIVNYERVRTCKIYSLNKDRFEQFGLSIEVWLQGA